MEAQRIIALDLEKLKGEPVRKGGAGERESTAPEEKMQRNKRIKSLLHLKLSPHVIKSRCS